MAHFGGEICRTSSCCTNIKIIKQPQDLSNNQSFLRQHCCLTICMELVELTNSETAAATPSGVGAKSLMTRNWKLLALFGELAPHIYDAVSDLMHN